MKIIGLIPARMAASRFPGKPLHPILGRPMIEHVFERAKLFPRWDALAICTCDEEIRQFAESKGYPVVMTSDTHTRALDRVAEAATWLDMPTCWAISAIELLSSSAAPATMRTFSLASLAWVAAESARSAA